MTTPESQPAAQGLSFSPRRLVVIGILTLIVGVLATAIWLAANDLGRLRETTQRIVWWWLPVLPLLTLVNLAIRFLRWNFLLRRIAAFVPLRENLRIFLASLSMVATPLHSGEALKALLLRDRAGTPVRQSGAVVVAERFFDLLALLLIFAATRPRRLTVAVPITVALLLIGWLLSRKLGGLAARLQADLRQATLKVRLKTAAVNFMRELRPSAFLGGLALSLAAWVAASMVLGVSITAVGAHVAWRESMSIFALATPLGALTMVPGGIGVTGSLMNAQLQGVGVLLEEATIAVILTRLATFWLATGLGSLFLLGLRRRGDLGTRIDQGLHFDDVSDSYEEEIPPHIREHLLEKKIVTMLPHIRPRTAARGLDIGCGHGWYMAALEQRDMRMVGLDRSAGQLRQVARGPTAGGRLLLADAGAIPLRAGVMDFAYTVNVLHHIEDVSAQQEALAEMLRVVRPGGHLFIHEINVINPLFRFYMGYVFPLINNIDLGTERWLDPRKMPRLAGATLEEVETFTFLPDFLPRPALRLMLPFERLLERSRWRRYAAHFVAIYRREA